jgi:hypothetical protein
MIENANLHLDTTGPEAVLRFIGDSGNAVFSAHFDHATAYDIGLGMLIFAADPLDGIRDLWRKLSPQERAEFTEELHLQPEGKPTP